MGEPNVRSVLHEATSRGSATSTGNSAQEQTLALEAASSRAGALAAAALDRVIAPLQESLLYAAEKGITEATQALKVDENLRTVRTTEALVDSLAAVWRNITGADNTHEREEALGRLYDELELESQPA